MGFTLHEAGGYSRAAKSITGSRLLFLAQLLGLKHEQKRKKGKKKGKKRQKKKKGKARALKEAVIAALHVLESQAPKA